MPVKTRILLRSGDTPPTELSENEPGLEHAPGGPKLWAGIGGVPVLLADYAGLIKLITELQTRISTLEDQIIMLRIR